MGRHASNKRKTRLAGWVWGALAAVAIIGGAGVAAATGAFHSDQSEVSTTADGESGGQPDDSKEQDPSTDPSSSGSTAPEPGNTAGQEGNADSSPDVTPPADQPPAPTNAPQPAPAHQVAQGTNMTFLLDTSGSMGMVEGPGTRLDNIRVPLAEKMKQVGQKGGAISLWNYSSPIHAGINQPFRDNVDISVGDDGNIAAAILQQLGFGGATHTYSSVAAAYNSALNGGHAAKGNGPDRLLLITDGPNDGGDLDLQAAVNEVQRMHSQRPVQLDIVTIGDAVDPDAMNQLAQAGGGTVFAARDSLDFARVLNDAVGS